MNSISKYRKQRDKVSYYIYTCIYNSSYLSSNLPVHVYLKEFGFIGFKCHFQDTYNESEGDFKITTS